MEVKIKKTHPDAVIPYKTHSSDFCYDCVAISEEEIAPNVWKYGLGLAFQVNRSWEKIFSNMLDEKSALDHWFNFENSSINISIDARPRSSVWKTGMVLSNCEGTIDEPYTGQVSAVFYHVMPNMPRYRVGDRICQIKLGFTLPMEFCEVEELEATDRGDGGYGSTGK
jgi:dUTP pyrophosphatase